MREILFKAKIKNWREQPKDQWWFEGYYCKRKSGRYTDIGFQEEYKDCVIKEFSDGGIIFCDVDPETVCQYTGLTDKNGRKIFEGDIVKGLFADEYIIGYIKYGSNARYYVERKGLQGILLDNAQDWLEVIGNIFDNPELLSGGKK